MLQLALEDPLGVLVGGKEGTREVKTGETNEKDHEHEHHDRRGQELEHIHRMVRDLELEVPGTHRRRNRDEHAKWSASVEGMEKHPVSLVPVVLRIGLWITSTETR